MTGDGLGRGLSDMWRSVLLFLPALLAFVVILVIGYVLARLLRTVVRKALHRVGFDRAVDRGPVGRALRGGNVTASELCAKIVFYGILLFALQLAFGVWGPNPVSDLLTALIAWLPRLLVAVVIVVVAAAIANATHDLIAGALGGLPYGRLLARVASVFIIALGVIAALEQVQIATAVTRPVLVAVLATVAGVIVVGVGGGLIRPMQSRWEAWLARAATESAVIRDSARSYAEEKARAEEARKAEEVRRAEEARRAEEERRAAEEARKAEEARRAEELRQAEEQRRAAEKAAEEARQAAAAQRVREAEEEARRKAEEEAARQEAARQRSLEAAATEETQVIAPRTADDRPSLIPGFDRDPDATAPVPADESERTQVLPPVPPGGTEGTQVLPGDDEPTDPGVGKKRR